MESSITEIVRGSSYPLSIIIIGVGQEDFTLMNELDADEIPLVDKYLLLACEVLEEIPS